MLTPQERDKFALYLEQEAATDDQMVDQLEKMGGVEPMVKKLRAEAMAAKIIAAKLRSIEDETIS